MYFSETIFSVLVDSAGKITQFENSEPVFTSTCVHHNTIIKHNIFTKLYIRTDNVITNKTY